MISPARSKIESMNAPSVLTWPVARASVPSNMSKTPPTKTTRPPTSQTWTPTRTAPTTVIANPMRVSAFGRQARAGPSPSAIGSKTFLIAAAGVVGDRHRSAGQLAKPRMARSRAANSAKASSRRRQTVSRPWRARLDDAGGAQPAEVPRDERLGQARRGRSARVDGRLAVGQAADDPQPVHVGHGLVERRAAGAGPRAGRRPRRWCCGRGRARGTVGWGLRLGGAVTSHQPRFISIGC